MSKMCKGDKQGQKRAMVSRLVAVPDTGCQKRDKGRCTWENYCSVLFLLGFMFQSLKYLKLKFKYIKTIFILNSFCIFLHLYFGCLQTLYF